MKKPRVYAATESPIHLLHRASQSADELFAKAADGARLTARQFVVLSIVADHSDPSQTIICEHSGIDRSTLADIVARLVARGLLSRKRTRVDGRKYAVRLTDAGRRALDEAVPAAQQVDQALVGSMTSQQRDSLLEMLIRVARSSNAMERSPA